MSGKGEIKAVLLAGGYATRLAPLSLRIPKVMVPVAGKPVLEHLISMLKNAGIADVVVSLNKNQKVIEKHFGDGKKLGVRLSYVYEDSMTDEDKFGAIGAIQYALSKVGVPKDCIVIGGDNIVMGLDLKKMREEHRKNKSMITVAFFKLAKKEHAQYYGIAKLDDKNKILDFQEKPKAEEAFSNLASTLVYHIEEEFLHEYLPAYINKRKLLGAKPDRPGDMLKHFVDKLPLYGHAFEGMWGDTNTIETYLDTNRQAMSFMRGSVPKKVSCRLLGESQIILSEKARVDETSVIKAPSIIEDGVAIGKNCVIGPCAHLGKGVQVGDNSSVAESIIFPNAKIGENARVYCAIIDENTILGDYCSVEEYSMIGHGCSLGKKTVVMPYSKVWPKISISPGSMINGEIITK
ncbi:NDP-sugar synthase [Candidatus Micrarchaeota archaeon]|nr:NDP-sugar synthase [Candidatus Micrarchaeota archaeon]